MEDTERLASTIGKNLTRLRKLANLTQLELAEKLNYSDKSVSKWEQGNGIPDVRILMQLAELYGVTLDDLVREHDENPPVPKHARRIQRLVAVLCSVGLCWLAAVVAFVFGSIIAPSFTSCAWLFFVYAVPLSSIVILVFSTAWHLKRARILSISFLIWSALASIYLTCVVFLPTLNDENNIWLLFLIGVPLQFLTLFYFVWRKGAKLKD